MKHFVLIIIILSSITGFSQNKLRPIDELINTKEPAWVLVKEWINSAKNKIQVLPCDSTKAREALYQTQVTTRSPMGAVVYSSGGLLIDEGWIRVLGSGNEKLNRSLPGWNKGKTFKEYGEQPGFLLIADDAIGGFFAINGGELGEDLGKTYYVYNFFPPLWSKEGKDPAKSTRKPIPIEEQYSFNLSMRKQLGIK